MAFAAFHELGPERIREVTGLDFEDFVPGQVFVHQPAITVTQQDNIEEALLTQNQARIHYDAEHAAATEFRRPLVVSTLTIQRALGMGWKTFGRRRSIVALQRIALTAPVFGGDTLEAMSRIVATGPAQAGAECGLVKVEIELYKVGGGAVGTISCEMEIYRRGRGPLPALGYTCAVPCESVHASHVSDANGALVETVGIEPDVIAPGLVIEHRPGFTFDAAEARMRARLAGDHSPVRIDPAVTDAAEARAIGTGWVLSVLTAATTRAFGLVVANLGWEDVCISAGVRDGGVVFAESEILGLRRSRSRPGQVIMHVRTSGHTREGAEIGRFERRLLAWRSRAERTAAGL